MAEMFPLKSGDAAYKKVSAMLSTLGDPFTRIISPKVVAKSVVLVQIIIWYLLLLFIVSTIWFDDNNLYMQFWVGKLSWLILIFIFRITFPSISQFLIAGVPKF